MPVKKGRLKKEDYDKVQKNYKFLLKELEAKDIVIDLYENRVFDLDDKEEIETAVPRSARNRLLLDKLLNSGPYEAYSVFKTALEESYQHVLTRIESTENEDPTTGNPYSWFNDISEQNKARVITEADASRISSAFGKDWKEVLLRLSLRQVQIEREEMKNPHASQAIMITHLLIQWKQKMASEATLENLMKVLMEVEDQGSCTIDWDMLQKAVEKMNDSN